MRITERERRDTETILDELYVLAGAAITPWHAKRFDACIRIYRERIAGPRIRSDEGASHARQADLPGLPLPQDIPPGAS